MKKTKQREKKQYKEENKNRIRQLIIDKIREYPIK